MSNGRGFKRSLRRNRVTAGRTAAKRVIEGSEAIRMNREMRAQTTNTKEPKR